MTNMVIDVPACLVMQATYVVSDTLTALLTRLHFMGAVCREDDDRHFTHLALLYCLYGQMQIVFVYQQYYWSVFRRFDMCCEVFYIS
jgi:hypothetical protein